MIEPIDLGIPGLTNIERIGAGGNAIVYRARQSDLDRDIVVKVLTNLDADTTRRRFDRERRAMGRLSQASGIAPLYGSGFTPSEQPYLLMPFYEHGSLEDHLENTGALEPVTVRDIGVVVSRAVQIAHENGVLHRDLKPANILISGTGQPDVADFGIAHLTDDALGASQALTMTPLYTAPEIFDGVESGAASDVYSIGATLFALLNGYPAHSDPAGSTPVLTLMRRINENPLPALPATVPTALAETVAKAMNKNPAERHQSAGQLAAELAAVDMTPPRPPVKKRSPALVVALVAVLLAAVGGAAIAFLLVDRSDTADDERVGTAVPDPTAVPTPAPTPAETDPSAEPVVFDLAAAGEAADQALVRVEAFGCTGADVATGVVLNDGIIVTDEAVLNSPWWIDVSVDGHTFHASADTSDPVERIALISIDDSTQFEVLPGEMVSVGQQVAIVGIDGRPALATIVESGEDDGLLWAEVVNAGAGNAIEPGDVIVTDIGGLVGVAGVEPGRVEVITIDRITNEENRTPPSYRCPTLQHDLRAHDSESAVSDAIGELLAMQQLIDAYADADWALVRQLEPGKAALVDGAFAEGWGPLRQGFIYPVGREIVAGTARWRIGLIGQETWAGDDLTTLFCVSWTVHLVSAAIVQTNEDSVTVYGSQPGQPQQRGFVDPADLRSLINAECPL